MRPPRRSCESRKRPIRASCGPASRVPPRAGRAGARSVRPASLFGPVPPGRTRPCRRQIPASRKSSVCFHCSRAAVNTQAFHSDIGTGRLIIQKPYQAVNGKSGSRSEPGGRVFESVRQPVELVCTASIPRGPERGRGTPGFTPFRSLRIRWNGGHRHCGRRYHFAIFDHSGKTALRPAVVTNLPIGQSSIAELKAGSEQRQPCPLGRRQNDQPDHCSDPRQIGPLLWAAILIRTPPNSHDDKEVEGNG